jgi:hypothetical protein
MERDVTDRLSICQDLQSVLGCTEWQTESLPERSDRPLEGRTHPGSQPSLRMKACVALRIDNDNHFASIFREKRLQPIIVFCDKIL